MEKKFNRLPYLRIGFMVFILVSCKKDEMISERCSLAPDPGLCKAAFTRYYYDQKEQKCKEFTWGGCGGLVPFETLEECKQCSD